MNTQTSFEHRVEVIAAIVGKHMTYDEMYINKKPRQIKTGIRNATLKFAAFKQHDRPLLESDVEAIIESLDAAGIPYNSVNGDIAKSLLYGNKYNSVYVNVVVDIIK